MNDDYQRILDEYPEYISKEQFYQICHISKKTAKFLLDSGLVPCIDSGRKTRRYKIKTKDVVFYLRDREEYPQRYEADTGYYIDPKRAFLCSRAFTDEDYRRMYMDFESLLSGWPDVLTINEVSKFTGYVKESVRGWCSRGTLKSLHIKEKYLIPKIYLLEYLASRSFMGIRVKTKGHINYINRFMNIKQGTKNHIT